MTRGFQAILMSLCAAAACSWVVDPNGEAPRCSVENDPQPCAEGFECIEGRCVSSEAPASCERELCANSRDDDCDGKIDEHEPEVADRCGDREDNDCDGKIDESIDATRPEACGDREDNDCDGNIDEGHDQDGDTHQWCGDTRTPDGAKLADCDDYNPDVHVGADERCNGLDDNCNGTIDENAGTLCGPSEECVGQRCVVPRCDVEGSSEQCDPVTEMCDLATGNCVPRGCSDAACALENPASFCDQTSGECRTVKRTNGEPCVAHEDCGSRSCIDAAAMRATISASRVCGKACCNDTDCGAGERCFASGSGARSCLPASLVPEPIGQAETCSFDNECPGTELCVVLTNQRVVGPWSEERDDLLASTCNEPEPGTGGFGAACFSGEDCGAKACVGDPNSLSLGICSGVCRISADCAGLDPPRRSYCRYVTGSTAQRDYLPVCVIDLGETGPGGFGAACTSGADCLDAACVGASATADGFCAPACCSDSQCPVRNEANSFCRPVPFGDHYEMRCVQ
jgi:hypothetical protein